MKIMWRRKGEIVGIETKGIKILTEDRKKLFIFKYNEGYEFDYDKLKIEIGDQIEVWGFPMGSGEIAHTAKWISKIIYLTSYCKTVTKTITLNPDYPEIIILNNYYGNINTYKGKVKKIYKKGIMVIPNNLIDNPGTEKLFILRQNGDYLFDFKKLNLQAGDTIEADIEELAVDVIPFRLTKLAKNGEKSITLSVNESLKHFGWF
ncbi:MAG: hypothetical protein WAQ98_02430 [Blastocatellia bacterium]